jgi:hypothetical protein
MKFRSGHFVFMVVKAALVVSLMVGAACSDGSKAGFSGACNSDGDCDSGLVCAQATLGGGIVYGVCTIECCTVGPCADQPDACQARFGNGAFCHVVGVCAKACLSSSDCAAGVPCDLNEDICTR